MKNRTFARFFICVVLCLFAVGVFAASQQTSSTTAQAIVDNVRVYLNEASAGFWDDTQLLTWLNDGMVDVVARTACLETTENISLVAATIEYSVTSAYLTIKGVQYVNASGTTKSLLKGNINAVGHGDDPGEPVYWYEWAGKIGVYPSLSSVTTESVNAYVITRPTAITLTDNITIPAIYDKALTYYMIAQALWRDRQTGRYAQMMSIYLQELVLYHDTLNKIPQELQDVPK